MRAVVFDGQLRLDCSHKEPVPASGEVRVRITLAGICATDLEIVDGYAGFRGILGHEFVGIVDRSEEPLWLGRRVVGEINVACGECRSCVGGRPSHCVNRTVLGIRGRDGALAEYLCLPARNLHLVPEAVTDRAAVFAEPLAAACEILEQVHVRPTDRVTVLGDGKLGLLVAQVLALTGCDLTVVGRHQEKLDILSSRAIQTVLADDACCGGADLVVECTGHREGLEMAQRYVRPQGTVVLKSTFHGPVTTDVAGLVVAEITVVGSRCGPLPAALRLLAQRAVDVTSLVEAEFPIQDALRAFSDARRPGSLKVLIRP